MAMVMIDNQPSNVLSGESLMAIVGNNDGVAITVNTLNEYQQKAKSTAVYPKEMGLVYTTLGLSGESGEVAEKVKKLIRDHGGVLDDEYRAKIAKELGDVLWYVAMVAHEIGYTLQDIAAGNNIKLASRKDRDQLHGDGDNR